MSRQSEIAEVVVLHSRRAAAVTAANEEPFSAVVERQLTACRRYGAGLAVLYIHLDGLVGVGERHGATVQRELLDTAWQRLHQRVRGVDVLGRMGPDTFGAVLFDVGHTTIGGIEARLFDELSAPYRLDDLVVEITAVTGSAVYPAGGLVADELMRNANRALRTKGG